MAKQTINIGAAPNDGTGTPLRTSFDYCNQNFTELYTATGPSGNNIVVPGSATITGDLTVRTNRLTTTTTGVGIGTAAPILPLDVRGTAGAGALFLKTTDPAAAVSSAYIQTPVSTGFSSLVPIYGFWYQNSGMGNPASDAISLITGSTERYRVDSAGTNTWSNVGGVAGTAMTLNSTGLGVGASPGYKLDVQKTSDGTVGYFRRIGATINPALTLYCNETGNTVGFGTDYAGATSPAITFTTAGSERVRIDASGNLLVNTTTVLDAAHLTVACTAGSGSKIPLSLKVGIDSAGYVAVNLRNQTASQGTIVVDVTGVRYLTASDYRLKEVLGPISGGLNRVNALKPSVYKWKADGSNGEGFIAHELAEVVPAAVNGSKDAVNEDGTINPQNVDMSRIVPILVAAIQELTARVQTLEAR